MNRSARVSVPASTANLGAGFDCLALALELRNTVELAEADGPARLVVEAAGEGAGRVPLNERNLIARAAERVFALTGRRPAGCLMLRTYSAIPLGSGLGSSAAAVVGGLAAANALVAGGLAAPDLLREALALEGHADNAAAALLGGLVLVSAGPSEVVTRRVPLALPANHPWRVVVALPDVHLPTAQARAALPTHVLLSDAVFNLGRALFTVQALAEADEPLLRWAVADRLHQPYREHLIPGYQAVESAARDAGAAAVALSGAGPSLLAFTFGDPQPVAAAMCAAFAEHGRACRVFALGVAERGTVVESSADG